MRRRGPGLGAADDFVVDKPAAVAKQMEPFPMRLFWICLALLLAAAAAVVLVVRHAGGDYVALAGQGNRLLAAGDAAGALKAYERAAALAPESADLRIDIAIADLRLGRNKEAVDAAQATLALDRNSPAAYYLMGCAQMHLFDWASASRSFQQSLAISPRVAAANFQLGLASEELGQTEAAVRSFQAAAVLDPSLSAAHFRLSRLFQKLGRTAESEGEMKLLQGILAKSGAVSNDPAALEACLYTRPRAPFVLEQPAVPGAAVRFANASAEAFGSEGAGYSGPVAVLDYAHDGRNSLLVREAKAGFRLLDNQAGRFRALGKPLPAKPNAAYRQVLVGDLDDDGFEDIIILGEDDSLAFRFQAGGRPTDYTSTAGLDGLRASSGLLADLDFTGNLDLVAVRPGGAGLQVLRNLGEFSFDDATRDLALPADLPGVLGVDVEDWGNDGLPTLFVTRQGAAPDAYAEHKGLGFTRGTATEGWPAGRVLAAGDLNNDLETDAVIADDQEIRVLLSGRRDPVSLPLHGFSVTGLVLADYDSDGWLDILAYGPSGLRVWRNEGHAGFRDTTEELGLANAGPVSALVAADFSDRGREDLVAVTPTGLAYYRNGGDSPNHLLRLRLTGSRTNASAIGARVEVSAGDWRTSRTVHSLPLEVGTGVHAKVDSVTIHWTDVTTTAADLAASPQPVAIVEPKLPTGSCPYLYAWDGKGFRFVTDVLGAAPLGLPLNRSRLVPSNPRELLALGNEQVFPARSGGYELRLTDELREVLYLDRACLLEVDHPEGTLVCPTSKLLAAPPFPTPELWTLRPVGPPQRAVRSDGRDVTAELASIDGRRVGPVEVRRPQLRGFARPYAVVMDFAELDACPHPVLALTGWLQFGGGMANIAASQDASVPPPFPTLEVQLPDGSWKRVETDVGAPCGKTKTILVDLEGRLPPGAHRLRLSTAFEIYWDAALLCERLPGIPEARLLETDRADLRWRGFSRYEPPAWGKPLTPDYARVSGTPYWDFTPAGWCTRYGDVRPQIRNEDDRLAILNGGDEIALRFPADGGPPKAPGQVRDFFLYLSGWDKDADFHVRKGSEVGPLPFRGMDDQRYGSPDAPEAAGAARTGDDDTRWVGPAVLARPPAPAE